MTRRSLTLAAGTVMSFMFGTAFADVPPAMDRVPADAAIVISVKNIGQFKTGIEALAKALGVPADKMAGMSKMTEALNMPGADAAGSAAIGVMNVGGEGDDADGVIVLPVKDYAAFVKNFGGTGAGLEELKVEEKPMFFKNLDGGFAAMGPKKDQLEQFSGKAGNGKALEALMGATGKAIAESDDLVIFANIAKLGDKIKEGTETMKGQMGMAMAMAGGAGGEEALAGMEKFMETFARDASAGVVGVKASEAGVTLDFGASFKEGTEYAGYFNSKGNASGLTANLPNQPFLFSMAMDSSNPGIKKMFQKIRQSAAKLQAKDDKAPGMFPTDFMDKADGIAFQIGSSPAPIGGLFLNTVAYIKTPGAATLAKQMKDSITGLNGKTVGGVSYTSSYESGVKAGNGTADAWSLKMSADPNDENAAMVNQINFVLFGANGLGGYAAASETGMVMTYSKNAQLLEQAVAATKGGANLSTDADVKKIAAGLPTDRAFEAYLGTKSLLETALGLMGMGGMAPANFNVPDDVPPVGMAATSNGGGLRFTIVVPTKVITTFQALGKAMDQGGDEEKPDAAPGKAGQPKF